MVGNLTCAIQNAYYFSFQSLLEICSKHCVNLELAVFLLCSHAKLCPCWCWLVVDVGWPINMWCRHGSHLHEANFHASVTEHYKSSLEEGIFGLLPSASQIWVWPLNQRWVSFCSLFPDVSTMLADVIFPSIKEASSGLRKFPTLHNYSKITAVGPTQLSVACSMEKQERAWDNLSHEWPRGREKGREDLIECRWIVNVPTHVVDR